ncbi:MAG TPA: HIT family protein [Pyrinomonadaceae bacterium]|nr:HIT family protein [Pyrinomonadaceae bacterium]
MNELSRRTFLIAGGLGLAAVNELLAQTSSATNADCIFCKIIAGTAPSYKLWEDKDFFAFLDNKPIMTGHTLVVPKNHHSYLFEMSKHDYQAIFERVRRLEPPLRSAMQAKRIGLIVEGFGVDHVHIHMVPLTGRGQLLEKGRSDVTPEEFKSVADKIKASLARK